VGPSTDKYVASTLLKELNEYLAKRSYLVRQTLTLADLAVYYAIESTMVTNSPIFLINIITNFLLLGKSPPFGQGKLLKCVQVVQSPSSKSFNSTGHKGRQLFHAAAPRVVKGDACLDKIHAYHLILSAFINMFAIQ
jgi:hypothetical protein